MLRLSHSSDHQKGGGGSLNRIITKAHNLDCLLVILWLCLVALKVFYRWRSEKPRAWLCAQTFEPETTDMSLFFWNGWCGYKYVFYPGTSTEVLRKLDCTGEPCELNLTFGGVWCIIIKAYSVFKLLRTKKLHIQYAAYKVPQKLNQEADKNSENSRSATALRAVQLEFNWLPSGHRLIRLQWSISLHIS